MAQLSMFGDNAFFTSYDDIKALLEQLREDDTDDDLFSTKNLTNKETKVGESYFIYGTKVLELRERKKQTNRLMVSRDIVIAMGQPTKNNDSEIDDIVIKTTEEANQFVTLLKEKKHFLFRNLITDTFSCCNDFERCSDAKECLHQKDRFYNGCYYRTNLEQGRIFYGKNRNIE